MSTSIVLGAVPVTVGMLVRCVDFTSLLLTSLDGVVSFVVIIVVGGMAGVVVAVVVVIDELLTSVVTPSP